MPVTGSEIPPELFECILHQLTGQPLSGDRRGQLDPITKRNQRWRWDSVDKRELGNCALVCKYWAAQCRPKLFYAVTLRSREDVFTLLAILDSPLSPMTGPVNLRLVQQYPCVPWIHLLPPLHATRRIYYDQFLSVTAAGPVPASSGSIRSIHTALPRSPPTFSQRINSLKLYSFHFRSFSNFVHLISELRHLEDLDCQEVTWSGDMPIQSLPSRKSRVSLIDISMTNCTVETCAVWLLMGLRLAEEPRVIEDEWQVVLALLQFLEFSSVDECSRRSVGARLVGGGNNDVSCMIFAHGLVGEWFRSSPSIYFGLFDWPPTSSAGSQTRPFVHIISIAISLAVMGGTAEEVLKHDWALLDEHASRLTTLKAVILGFRTREEMTKFVEAVATSRMPRLSESGKVKFAIKQDGAWDGEWLLVAPHSSIFTRTATKDVWRIKI